ncbi:YopX family protein [Clostridium sp. DJ247]|uniref:YopX family protein n=1 Tax=Clostridium sp. DJ247 TaxID=2726188 RepID=UPI001628C06E|nr:YopX family protein [Clostridium sp. DJ247]MBC2581223.1 hypothetical protein [Clostridium sp. DJ247]
MNREFKFRAWSIRENKFYYHIQNIVEMEEYFKEKDKFVVTQYTGLRDKSNREIYEGDIIAINNETSSVKLPVKFGKYAFRKYIGECGEFSDSNEIYGFYVENEYLYIQMINKNVIIVGNIFENQKK